MSSAQPIIHFGKFESIQAARRILQHEAEALARLSKNIPSSFDEAVSLISACHGAVIVCGIGKAGWIGQKISASLASTGTRSHYLHPSEAMHGDLGRIGPDDVVLMLSNSGETEEVLQVLPALERIKIPVIAVVGRENSTLAKHASVVLCYESPDEACALGLAPSTSTTLMLAMGDAIALVVSESKGFLATDFARFHPGGSLGRKLSIVNEIMRPLEACRVTNQGESIRNIYIGFKEPGRRSGAILLTNERGVLTGLFTDSDLARLLESQQDALFDQPIERVMTSDPITVVSGTKTLLAIEKLACHNISELPVVDSAGRPLGIVDITDVVSLLPP